MNYLGSGSSNMPVPAPSSRSDIKSGFPLYKNDAPRARSSARHQSPVVMSIEEMHKCYVKNKAELTKHVSIAAGAKERLWGGDGWFVKWYEMPSTSSDTTQSNKETDVVIVPERRTKAKDTATMPRAPSDGIDLIKAWRDVSWHETHNLVEHVNIPAHMTAGAVKNIVARFADQQRRFSWVVGPQEQPVVETVLQNAQMWCEETAPALSAVLEVQNDLFCDIKASPVPSQARPLLPTTIADSDTLPPRERLPRVPGSGDVLLAQFEALGRAAAGEAAWPDRRPAYTQNFAIGLEAVSNYSRPQNAPQTTRGSYPTPSDRPVAEVDENIQQGTGTICRESPSFQTAVGDFENLDITDASPGHAERVRVLRDRTNIHILTDKSEVKEWVRTWAYGADPESANVKHWTGIYSALIEKLPPNQIRMFAARKSKMPLTPSQRDQQDFKTGEMIGTGYVHLYAGVASIHCITVLPQYRSQGLGSALTRYAMGIGKDMGLGMAMLTASTIASSYGGKAAIFSKLGFKEFGRVKQYVYRPPYVPPPTTDTLVAALVSAQVREAENEGWEWVDGEDDESD